MQSPFSSGKNKKKSVYDAYTYHYGGLMVDYDTAQWIRPKMLESMRDDINDYGRKCRNMGYSILIALGLGTAVSALVVPDSGKHLKNAFRENLGTVYCIGTGWSLGLLSSARRQQKRARKADRMLMLVTDNHEMTLFKDTPSHLAKKGFYMTATDEKNIVTYARLPDRNRPATQ